MQASILSAAVLFVASAVAASTLTPPVLPLIVRNPYLSTWLADARDAPWKHWPMFWTGESVGFSIMVSVKDTGLVYPLLGRPQDSLSSSWLTLTEPIYNGASYDASTTNLTYTLADPSSSHNATKITISFLSPITPGSILRQSLPAAYFTVYADGDSAVNVYADVNGQWVSGDRDNTIVWAFDKSAKPDATTGTKSWTVSRETEQLFTEINDRSEWGTLYFTGPAGASYQCGTSAVLRHQFVEHGRLSNEVDSRFRQIMDDEPVFAFSGALGPARDTSTSSITFTLGLIQNPVVQFAAARGLTDMRPLWSSYLSSTEDMILYHYKDFQTASMLARNYSTQLAQDARESGPGSYEDIVALSARQVLGATQFSGTAEDPIIFLKEISSNGNFQTVDVIFPSFPFFLYTNPQWLLYLLDPLIEHQLSGQYPNKYSMHDLGAHFPNATGHADGRDEYMPVEECGDMLIMGLAVTNALRSGSQVPLSNNYLASDLSTASDDLIYMSKSSGQKIARHWLRKSYMLWKQWTGYLVREALIPRNQLCTDDFAGWLANQTNLALKGIIGIRAMSEIADFLGEDADAKYYKNISDVYIEKWQEYGISRDKTHAKLAYTWFGSWTTIYNLFADALLCFHLPESAGPDTSGRQLPPNDAATSHLIPDYVYSMQSKWYSAVLQRYGLPLDSRHLYTKSDWEFFAGAVTSAGTREALYESVARWVNETVTNRPFTDLYDTEGEGDFSPVRFMARPVVGGHFARLVLERACGGKATAGLDFLEKEAAGTVDVAAALAADISENAFVTGDGYQEL